MKQILKNIISYLNNYRIRAVLSSALSLLIMLVVPDDAFLSVKLGKTLLYVLFCLCVYNVFSIACVLFKEKPHDSYNIVDDFYKVLSENEEYAPLPDTSPSSSSVKLKEKTKVSLKERNVMIGTVRTPQQLKFNLENNCYYTPARFVSCENLPLKSVAIYECDENGKSVIKRVGNVKNAKLVTRSTIPVPSGRKNGDEKYWYFELESWENLEKPICVKDTYRGKPLYTNSFLLENCDYSYQLVSVTSPDEYVLAKAVESFLGSAHNTPSAFEISDNRTLHFENNSFIIKNNKGETLCIVSAYLYSKRPKQMFDKLKLYI